MPSSFILVRGKVPDAIAAQRRVTTPASFTNSEFPKQYALHASVILDSGSTTHVCNDINRFIEYQPTCDNEVLYAGDSIIPITGVGTIQVVVDRPGASGGRVITLKDTVYVPSFHYSVALLKRFIAKGVHWDTANNRLTYKDKTFCLTPIWHSQWCIEYNPQRTPQHTTFTTTTQVQTQKGVFKTHSSRKPKPLNTGTLDEWHDKMGHLYEEALSHMPGVTTGVKLTTLSLSAHKCE